MKRVVLLLFVFSFITLQFSPSQVLASCAQMSISEQKELSDIIALGTATQVTGQNATIEVDRYFKGGETPPQLVVSGRQSSEGITSVDFEFQEGKDYLLFLKKVVYTGALLTDACSGTREVSDGLTPDEYTVLGSGEGVTPPPVPSSSSQSESKSTIWIPMAVVGVAILFSIPLILVIRKR